MNLKEKIKQLRPNITDEDFYPDSNIELRDNSTGDGPYIAHWNHPTETQPTQEELDNV